LAILGVNKVFSYLDALVVLDPKSLREKMGGIVGKMNEKYLSLHKGL
jgi:hypothetical protein